MMETEQTPPEAMPGKRVIEVEPPTQRGIEAVKQLDEAFENFLKWVESIWGADSLFPHYRATERKWIEFIGYALNLLGGVMTDTLNTTGFKRI